MRSGEGDGRIGRYVLAALSVIGLAGCQAVPYQPSREIVSSIPEDMAKDALREAAADTQAWSRSEPLDADPNATTSITFTESGFRVTRSHKGRSRTFVATYGKTRWAAHTIRGFTNVELGPVTVEYSDQPADYFDSPVKVFILNRGKDELALKTLDALESLGVKRATTP